MKQITKDDYLAAIKVKKAFEEQEIANAIKARDRKLQEIAEAVEGMGDPVRLEEWGRRKWEHEKGRGVGGVMDEQSAKAWYIRNLKRAMVDVIDAYGIDPRKLAEAKQ